MDTGKIIETVESTKRYWLILETIDILKLVIEVGEGKKSEVEILQETREKIESFVNESIPQITKAALDDIFTDVGIDDPFDFPNTLVSCSKVVMFCIRKFIEGVYDEEVFIEEIFDEGMLELILRIYNTCGFDMKLLAANACLLRKVTIALIMLSALPVVYNELQKAYHELNLTYEQKQRINEERNAIIVEITEQRKIIEEMIFSYLTCNLADFSTAIWAMQKAVLEYDTAGYIKDNVMIQNALGYGVQFTKHEEF